MQKTKRLRRGLSLLLVLALIVTSISGFDLAITSEASEISEAELKKALAKDKDEYPEGGLEFFQSQLVGSEGDKKIELTVVRRGVTDKKATVNFKAVDVSASYGEDYTLAVKKSSLVTKVLEKKSGSKVLTEYYTEENATVETAPSSEDESENGDEQENKTDSKKAVKTGAKSALHAAKDTYLKTDTDAFDWKKAQGEAQAKAEEIARQGEEAANKFAEEVEGVGCELTFKEGEYKKEIIIDIVDDKVSETDEQVMFLLSNAAEATLASATTAYLNIQDNDNNEKVVFAMDSDSVKVDSDAKKAKIKIRRVSGKEKMASVIVGTGSQTAKAGEDYVSFKKEVMFAQGVTEQTVEVELLKNKKANATSFQVALDAENSYVKDGAATTTVTIKADPKAAKKIKEADEDEASAQAASEWKDSRNMNVTASVCNRSNTNSSRVTVLDNIDLSTATRVDVTWESTTGSTIVNEKEGSGCDERDVANTYKERVARIYVNDQVCWETKGNGFSKRTNGIEIADHNRITNGKIRLQVGTYGKNRTASATVSKIVIVYPGYQFTVTNTPYEQSGNSNKYTEKVYSADGDKTDAAGHRYSEGEQMVLGTLQVSKNGAASYSDSVTVYRGSMDRVTFKHNMYKNKTSHGVAIDASATGNVYLAGYQLRSKKNSYTWSNVIKPDDFVFSKSFINTYKAYILTGNEFVVRPVYRPYTASVYLQNSDSSKGYYDNGFKNGEIFKCTQLDTIKLRGIAQKGYAVNGFNLGTCYGTSTFHNSSSSKNVLATKGDQYRNQADVARQTEVKKYAASSYAKVAVSNADINKVLPNVVTFSPTKEFTYTNIAYTTPKITAKINPKSENKDKGVIVYTPKDESGNPDASKVLEGSYKKDLVIEGITINQEYTLNAITEDGFKALFQDFTGDENGDGKIDVKEEKVVSGYNIIRTANNGNAYSFRPAFNNVLIYYAFQKSQENRYAGTLDGVVALKSKPIFGDEETITPINGAQVTAAGQTTTTKDDEKFGGYDENGGAGYFSISSRDFSVGDNVTVNVSYNNLYLSATQAVNAAQRYLIDAYDTIGVSDAGLYQVKSANDITAIEPGQLNNADKTFRVEIKTASKNDALTAEKAIFRFYRKDGTEIATAKQEKTSQNGIFVLDFNPATLKIPAGASMTVQFVDQHETAYFEHDFGVVFAQSLGVLSFLSSFNFGGAEKALELIGTIDSAFNFGWDGDIDEKTDMVSTSKDGNEKIISLGFAFNTDWDSDDSDAAKEQAVKDTAKNNASTTTADKQKQSKTVDDSVDKADPKAKSNASVGVGVDFACSFGLKVSLAKSTDADHKGEWYFKEMLLAASVEGGVTVNVTYVTPIGLPIRVCMAAGGSGSATFVIEQNYDKKEYYISDVMDKSAAKVDIFDFNMSNADNAFSAYGIFNVSPFIDLSAGAGFDFLNLMVGGRADFNMNFYTRSDQQNTGAVDLSAYIKLKVLFFEKKWNLVSKNYNLFGNASGMGSLTSESYLYASLSDMKVEDTSYLKNRGKWNGSTDASAQSIEGTSGLKEADILTGMYPEADIKMQRFGNDGKVLAIFLDKDTTREAYNATALYYTIYDEDKGWSDPELVESDGTVDSEPSMYDLGDKGIYVAWSTSSKKYTEEPDVLDSVSDMDIHGVFFDKTAASFKTDIHEITKTKPYSYIDEGRLVEDYVGDVNPSISYDAVSNKMMVFYTKNEYEATVNDEGVYGDVANPYSLIAYRTYNFTTNKWEEEDIYAADDFTEDYKKAWYGQRFLDVEIGMKVEETIDEDGYWTEEPTVTKLDKGIEPLIVEKDVVSYNSLAILTYIADYDQDKTTTADRDVFMQVYDYVAGTFTHPIMITTSPEVEERELSVGYSNGTAIMTYISDGTLRALNLTSTSRCLLKKTLDEKDYYIIDRSRMNVPEGEELQGWAYQPVIDIVGKDATPVVETEGVEDEEDKELLSDKDMAITDVKLKSTDRYIYALWTQRDTKLKEGIDEASEEAQKPENTFVESQIYAMRFDNKDGTMTQPVQVTEGAGCNYSNLDYIVEDGDKGEICVLGLKAGTSVEKVKVEGQDDVEVPAVDYNQQKMVELRFTPASTLTLQDIAIEELSAGTDSPVAITLFNDGLQTLTDLTVTVVDENGDTLHEEVIGENATAETGAIKSIYGGEAVTIDFPITLGEDEKKTSFSFKVVDKDKKVLLEDSYEEEIPIQVDVSQFKARLVDRETIEFAVEVTNNSRCKSGEQTVSVSKEYDDGDKKLIEIPIESLNPGESVYLEKQYNFGEYDNMFKTELTETESYVAKSSFKAESSAGKNAETDITLEATKEQRLRMSAIKSVDVVDEHNFAVQPGDISQLGVQIDSIPYAGSRYNGMDQEDNVSDTSGLRVLYKSNSDAIQMYDNGYYEAIKDGKATVTAYVLPNSNQVSYNAEEGSLVDDNFTTLPEEMIMVKTFTIQVGNTEQKAEEATPAPTATEAPATVTPSATAKPATSIRFASRSLKMGVKESIVVKPTLSKKSSDKLKNVTYTSTGKVIRIKKVSGGKVKITAKKTGKGYVTVKTSSGAKAKLTVTVKKAPKSIKAKKKVITLKAGKTKTLKYTLSKGAASYTINVKSNRKKLVKVLSGNKIKALKKGTAVITLQTYNGKKAKIKVKVKK